MTETSIAAPEWIALTVVAWLATYIVHSTLLIGTVWGFTRCCALDSLTRSLLWKLALVGGLFTATLQTGLGVRPWLGQVAVAGEAGEANPANEARWEARSPRVLLPRMLALHVDGAAGPDELEALIEAQAEAIEVEAEAIEAQAEAIEAAAGQVEVQAEIVAAKAEALAAAHESEAAQLAVDAERDAAQAGRDAAQIQRDEVQARRDGVQAERDAVQSERDARQAERDAVQAARDELSLAMAGLHMADPRSAGFMVFTGPSSDCRGPACPWVHVPEDSQTIVPLRTPAAAADEPTRGPWGLLAGLFLIGMTLSVGRLVWLATRLRGVLRGREPLTHGGLRERLHRLMTRARLRPAQVRLTLSPVLRSPIALASREIVVPTRALDLDAQQQEAMLAHELAHVVRRDPAWLVLAAVIEAALFIQPLNRVARRGMQEAAEELSDDWAVRHIGDGLHLARCLAEVAGWLERGRSDAMFVSPMASEGGSILVRRVRRLLEAGPRRGLAVQWRMLLAACLLFAAGFGAPGFAPALAHAGEAPGVVAPAVPAPPAPIAPSARLAMPAPMAPPAPLAMLAPPAPPAMLAPPAPLAMLAPPAPPAMLAPPAPRALIVPAAPRAALAPVAPRAMVAASAPGKPTLRQRRLERRADRLTRKAIKQAEKAVVLRERSGLQNTCPDAGQAERRRSQADRERAVAVALAGAHPRVAVVQLPDFAEIAANLPDADELRREIEEGLRELPDADELRREIEEGLRELPDAAALEREVEAGLRELPSQADLERRLQAALRELPKDLPNRAEVERSLRDAIKNLPDKNAIRVQVKDALKQVPSKADIDRQVRDALRNMPDKAQIEQQVRDAMRNMPNQLPNKAAIDRQVRDALKNLPNKAEIERQVKQGLRNLPDAATLERQVKQAEQAREQAEKAREQAGKARRRGR